MLDLLIVQPTPFCNINCSYCYLAERSNTHKIALDTVQKITDRLLDWPQLLSKRITVVFHAGEPLVLKPDYYKPIFDTFNRLSTIGIEVEYSVQTNGTLLSQEWCDFIKTQNIRIGISLDGPEFINDMHRVTRSGKGTFAETMKGVELLRKNDIPYHAIAVVTDTSMEHAADIFNFFHDNGFYQLGLNIEEQEGTNTASSMYTDDMYPRIKQFYEEMMTLFKSSDGKMTIREFDSCRRAIFRELEDEDDITKLAAKTHQTEPFRILSIDYRGNFSTYSPELLGQHSDAYNNFIIGNVFDTGFKEAYESEFMKRWNNDVKDGIALCKSTCQYFSVCGGGSPGNKYYENNSFSTAETKYCKYHIQLPLDIVLSEYEQLLAQ